MFCMMLGLENSKALLLSDSELCSPSGGSIYSSEGHLRILDKLVLQIFLCVEINLSSTQAVNRILVRLGANYGDQTTTSTNIITDLKKK